jgi:hypothetical protein
LPDKQLRLTMLFLLSFSTTKISSVVVDARFVYRRGLFVLNTLNALRNRREPRNRNRPPIIAKFLTFSNPKSAIQSLYSRRRVSKIE